MSFPVDPSLGIVLGVCGHWWQAAEVIEVMERDCPHCGRPPGIFIDCWDEAWPEITSNVRTEPA